MCDFKIALSNWSLEVKIFPPKEVPFEFFDYAFRHFSKFQHISEVGGGEEEHRITSRYVYILCGLKFNTQTFKREEEKKKL